MNISPPDIPTPIWERLEPWLQLQQEQGNEITLDDVADFLGLDVEEVRCEKWLDSIARHFPRQWEITELIPVRPSNRNDPLR